MSFSGVETGYVFSPVSYLILFDIDHPAFAHFCTPLHLWIPPDHEGVL